MCGRFAEISAAEKITKKLQFKTVKLKQHRPRYNIAPSQPVLVIVEDPQRKLEVMQWGFVPSWSKDPAIGHWMINARSETLNEKPSFRGPFKTSRCLIPSDGFYEWKKEGALKQPYFICRADKEPFAFGGLWSHWTGPDGSEIISCAIITKEADEFMRPIHSRMPVVIEENDYECWLGRNFYRPEELEPILQKSSLSQGWTAYPVTTYVNMPAHDDEHCLQPA